MNELWSSLQDTKEEFLLSDKSPKRLEFRFGDEAPQVLTKDTTNHEIFSFCQKFLEKYHTNYPAPKLREDIRYALSDAYGDISLQIMAGKNLFSCFTRLRQDEPFLKIDFYYNRKTFQPYRWDHFDKSWNLYFSEEDESKSGKKDSFTRYEGKSCPKEITKDRNEIGGIDEWWYFDKCLVSKIEYDENENGFKERVCYFESGKPTHCDGVGEKEEKEAKEAELKENFALAGTMYRRAIDSLKKEFNKPSSRTCSLLKDLARIEYNTKNYTSFKSSLDEFLNIPICEKTSLDILVYKGYYQLYLSNDSKGAKKTYRQAAEVYQKDKGEENPELVMNLALAEYQDNDPLSCLASLERLNERRLQPAAKFFYYYYRGSCSLSLGKDQAALSDLKKSWDFGWEKEYQSVLSFKLALAHYKLQKQSEGKFYLEQALQSDPELLPWAEKETAFFSFFETKEGKKLKIKYYLNREQNSKNF
ncbi:tetratricopeptide repeat protein [Leptospira idonii]|uniref:Tetratricopeptide repeat protein n=1 Tax=Leptospira idonii TaxID=1193500 RepID=A0A4R9LWR2_9LEPT|nr:tetratricopeptide repeat protein [Leptospira idonii]TGN18733.1 tetratricopeptide repeat protein [Leptospira idonii]